MAKKKAKELCNCVAKVNAQLEESGLELDDCFVFDTSGGSTNFDVTAPVIQLRWIEPKKKSTPPMFCAYCPFCGKRKE